MSNAYNTQILNILALETSGELCSVALWRDGEVVSREVAAGQRHSELLLPMVDELLAGQGLTVRNVGAVAFGAGPGSFTGLRIACGVAQGIAFGAGLPVVGVSTLLALAEAAEADRVVCCLDARMGEVYHAAYERLAGSWNTVHEPALCSPSAVPPLPDDTWTGCGSGFAAYGAALANRYGATLACVKSDVAPHARQIAALAAIEFERGAGLSAEHAAPVYIRNKVALRVDER